MRPGTRVVLALLLAAALGGGVLAGCSDDGERMAEFCAAAQELDDAGPDWKGTQQAAREWQQVGVPEEVPDNVRRGLTTGLRLIIRAPDAATIERRVARLSPEQQDDLDSVDAYLAEECAD